MKKDYLNTLIVLTRTQIDELERVYSTSFYYQVRLEDSESTMIGNHLREKIDSLHKDLLMYKLTLEAYDNLS